MAVSSAELTPTKSSYGTSPLSRPLSSLLPIRGRDTPRGVKIESLTDCSYDFPVRASTIWPARLKLKFEYSYFVPGVKSKPWLAPQPSSSRLVIGKETP